jgi:hypothetical protein
MWCALHCSDEQLDPTPPRCAALGTHPESGRFWHERLDGVGYTFHEMLCTSHCVFPRDIKFDNNETWGLPDTWFAEYVF